MRKETVIHRLSSFLLFTIFGIGLCSCSDGQEFPGDIVIYPNPSTESFFLSLRIEDGVRSAASKQYHVIIQFMGAKHHSKGEILLNGGSENENPVVNDFLEKGVYEFWFDISSYESGHYILDVSIDGIAQRTRVWKK